MHAGCDALAPGGKIGAVEWDMMPGVSAAAAADVPKQAICSSRLTEASAATFRRAVQKHYWWGPPCCPAPCRLLTRQTEAPGWVVPGGISRMPFLHELHAAVYTVHSHPGAQTHRE